MASVDDRIVRMEFDNASFERKLDSTLSSLSQLDKALKMQGATKGLSDVNAAAGKINFGSASEAVSGFSAKFMAMSTIAITALASITSKAISTGAALAKSLTVGPMMDGFKEYETNMNSIQTILANTSSKGTKLTDVNNALDELNKYSDQTIYNFAEMAKNIGTFTAAGVDLKTSTSSIKGIANIAAMSGSSSQQASTAMYQLSQAVATGSLKLMDWNSVVNAGMGGEAMKSALFETGKAMGTLTDVPMGQSFKEWEDSGHSFRESLQDEWVTSDVLTTTLSAFTGDMTKAQLVAKGFSEQQADAMLKQADIAKKAATEVKTFTQLVGTVKEAIGTGWADSFKIVIGNFEEAKALWTGVNTAISDFVGKNAEARNNLLAGWKMLGGRDKLISGLKSAFSALGAVVTTVSRVFREVFPKKTPQDLAKMTDGFAKFTKMLYPSADTLAYLARIFKGFFSILSIGWTVLKETVKFLKDMFIQITGAGTGNFLKLGARVANFFDTLRHGLVQGKGIEKFFDKLRVGVVALMNKFVAIKTAIVGFFKSFDKRDSVEKTADSVEKFGGIFDRLKQRFGQMKGLWDGFEKAMMAVVKVLDKVWQVIKDWFSTLGQQIADAIGPGDFSAVMDALNVSLIGGVFLLIKKYLKGGMTLNVGFLDKIGESFSALTEHLKTMTLEVKAKALMKIAEAIAVLTASVLVLSLIDSGNLTKALAAMAVGFTQLVGAFAAMDKIGGTKGAGKMNVMATGMILLGTAVLVMAGAVRILSGLDPEQLATGLSAMGGILAGMTGAAKVLGKDSKGLVAAGLGMIGMAVAMNIMAGAVKLFSMMDWQEIVKGLGSIGAALVVIGLAMKLFPKRGMLQIGAGLLLVSVSLNIIAASMKIFASMNWTEIGKGLVGIGGALLIIAGAMHLMPKNMLVTGAGLLAVAVALNIVGGAMKIFASMDWGEIGKGLLVMAASLLIMALGAAAMKNAIPGAIAIVIVSASLMIMAKVLKELAKIPFGDLMKAILGIALVFVVFGVAAYALQNVAGVLIALGAALFLVGAAFALFGAGAYLAARGVEIFVKAGPAASKAMTSMLKAVGAAIPALIQGFAEGIVELARVFIKAAPVFAKLLGVLVNNILDTLIKAVPKLGKLIRLLINEIIRIVGESVPKIIQLGIDLIMALLTGIRDNIGKIVEVVADIIINFVDALTDKVGEVADSVYNFIVEVVDQVYSKGAALALRTSPIGVLLSSGLLDGVKEKAKDIAKWFGDLAGKVAGWVGNVSRTLFSKGISFIGGLWNGISDRIKGVTSFFRGLRNAITGWLGDTGRTLASKGTSLISGLWNGITGRMGAVTSWFRGLTRSIGSWVGDMGRTLAGKGGSLISGLLSGITGAWSSVTSWLGGIASKVASAVPDMGRTLYNIGSSIIGGLIDGIKAGWEKAKVC